VSLAVCARLHRDSFELNVDIAFPLQGVTALFGRSGCGKTTLLRVIAGLERARGATVTFDGQIWQQGRRFVPLHKRRVGLVFQEHSLLANLTARQNLLYGYERTPRELRRLHLPETVAMLEIGGLLDRPVDRLSGGERQRVSLGRALLTSPRMLLLDEPLAALDVQTKREIMPFLARLASEAGVPIVMVTHAADEVERLADRVAFMGHGRIDRIETLQAAMRRPDSPLFADEGAASIFEGWVGPEESHGLCAFGSQAARLWIPAAGPAASRVPTRVRILARDVALALDDPPDISIRNRLPVTIEEIVPLPGNRTLVTTRTADGALLLAEVTPWAVQQLQLEPGQGVFALIKSVALVP
jgi:molybdate transport system ATP-binding protein